jgi:hypothetical protein
MSVERESVKSGHDSKDTAMITTLRSHLHKLERAKQRFLAELGAMDDDMLRRHPAPGAWSALDLVEHLILTEVSILDAMRRNVCAQQKVGFRDKLGMQLVNTGMLLPGRVKVPAGAAMVVPKGRRAGLSELAEQWSAVRVAMTAFLEGVESQHRSQGVFRHPIGGWTTIEGTLSFLQVHLFHHRYQLRRIRRAIARPA